VPSGASTGIHEALELRDKGKDYHGKGYIQCSVKLFFQVCLYIGYPTVHIFDEYFA